MSNYVESLYDMVKNPTWGPSKVFPINKGFCFIVNKIGERSMNPEYTTR